MAKEDAMKIKKMKFKCSKSTCYHTFHPNRLTHYLQCDECKATFHSKTCSTLKLTRDRKKRLCENCFPRCECCHRLSRRGVECEHCNNYYCGNCFTRYFEISDEILKKEEPYNLRNVPPVHVAKCTWCSVEKINMIPILMNDTNVPEGACVWCWSYKKRWIPATMKNCKCGEKNLCKPHATYHNCEARCHTAKAKIYIEQHPEKVKDHLYKKLKGEYYNLAVLCYDIDDFPK